MAALPCPGGCKEETKYSGLRAQNTDRAEAAHNAPRRPTAGTARGPELFQLFEDDPGGSRPPCLGKPRGPGGGLRHTVDQMADICPFVQILDAPVPQMRNEVLDVFRLLDTVLPEQVMDVPKISQDSIPQRLVDCDPLEPQTAEQLVEVPTAFSLALLQQQVVEQIVDNQVPRGRDDHGGLQGFHPEQS